MSGASAQAVSAFRIARATRNWRADDLSGTGAARYGGRWNAPRTPMVYASANRSLAALEVLVHMREPHGMALPLVQYLVEIAIPASAWEARERFDAGRHSGWDATPASSVTVEWGTAWADARRSLVAVVPSVVMPEENNILINPLHPDAGTLRIAGMRAWRYDDRIKQRSTK